MNIAFPLDFDGRGRTAAADDERHLRDLIEQVLFTTPGERVNRPTFGSGVLALVFAANGDVLAAASQFAVQSALQQWLGDLIQVDAVDVQSEDAALRILVRYTSRRTRQSQTAEFVREGTSP